MQVSKVELLGFIIIGVCNGCHGSYFNGSNSECSNEWDYLTFRQQWPPTFCMEEQCKLKEATTWTVHGLWPTQIGDKYCPSSCNRSDPFNLDEIQNIEGQLKEYWPNLRTDDPYDQFWKTEWAKHGTCATSLPALGTELKYFSKAIELNRKFNVFEQLKDSGIIPGSKPYQANDVLKVVQLFGSPEVRCYYSEGKKYLYNIEICFNKAFQLKKCGNSQYDRSNGLVQQDSCTLDGKEDVYYPQVMRG